MLINLSNHPYEQWSQTQKNAAQAYGECVDLPFPTIDPEGDETYIEQLAESYAAQVLAIAKGKEETTVHLMGEMTFTFTLLQMLLKENITCIASTSERISVDLGSGQKETRFDFVRFRKYINL
jgi:hypothetical protein